MRYPGSRTLIASLSVLTLILATSETFAAGPGVAAVRGGAFAAHPAFRPGIGRPFGHHRGRNNAGAFFWPGYGDWGDYDGSTPGGYGTDVPPPQASGDVHYTYTYDVPWDQIHRFPPNVLPSARPYVPDCTAQTVTVPRRAGGEPTESVNITRCY
jgi:hypothetical protein